MTDHRGLSFLLECLISEELLSHPRLAHRGEYARARAWLERGLPLARAAGNRYQVASVLFHLGMVAMQQGELERAGALLDESLATAREVSVQSTTVILLALGTLAHKRGNLAQASRHYEASLALARAHEDRHEMARNLIGLGRVAHLQGDAARAMALLEEGLALARAAGHTPCIGEALHGLGLAAGWQGDAARATALLRESLALRRETGERLGLAECLEGLATVAAGAAQPELATRLLGAAEALRAAIGAPLPPVDQTQHAATVQVAREALGEDAFAVAWAAGRALPLERAVAEALGAEDAIPAPPAAPAPRDPAGLTRREAEVLDLLADGATDAAIAAQLSISVNTVNKHVASILAKTGAANRTAAARHRRLP